MLLRFLLLSLVVVSFFAGSAHADDYVKPTWPDLTRTLIRFSALSLADQNILDEYAVITESIFIKPSTTMISNGNGCGWPLSSLCRITLPLFL